MKNFYKRKILGIILLTGLMLVFVTPCLAACSDEEADELASGIIPCGRDYNCDGKLNPDDPGEKCTLCDLIKGFKKLFDYGITTIIVICLACATFAGVMYVVSAGSEKMMESAKAFLKGSLIGLAVVLCSWVIVNTVITVLMPTKKDANEKTDFGIGKMWDKFGSISCPK